MVSSGRARSQGRGRGQNSSNRGSSQASALANLWRDSSVASQNSTDSQNRIPRDNPRARANNRANSYRARARARPASTPNRGQWQVARARATGPPEVGRNKFGKADKMPTLVAQKQQARITEMTSDQAIFRGTPPQNHDLVEVSWTLCWAGMSLTVNRFALSCLVQQRDWITKQPLTAFETPTKSR